MKYYLKEDNGWLIGNIINNLNNTLGFCVDGVEQILGIDVDYDKHYILDVRFKNPRKAGFQKIFLVWNSLFCKLEVDYSGLFLSLEADQIIRELFPDFRIERIVLWARIVPN